MKYKKGDMVRVVRDGSVTGHMNELGKVYRILSVDPTSRPPYLLQKHGVGYWCSDNDLELAWNFNDYINQIK